MGLVARLRALDLSLAAWTLAAFGGSLVLWVVYWFFSASAFDLTARSEVVQLATGCRTQPRWIVPDAMVRVDGGAREPFTGQIEIGPRAQVRIERIGKGAVRIMVDRQRDVDLREPCDAKDVRSLAVLVDASTREDEDTGDELLDPDERAVAATLTVEAALAPESTVTLPFVGWADVGQTLKSATRTQSPILRSGKVSFLRSFFFTVGFGLPHPAGERTLSPGDRFFVPEQRAPGFGFARADEEAALLVGYRASGTDARIDRFGTRGYAIGPTIVEAFVGDSSVQALLAVLGAVATLAQTVDLVRRKREAESSARAAAAKALSAPDEGTDAPCREGA